LPGIASVDAVAAASYAKTCNEVNAALNPVVAQFGVVAASLSVN
jgi:hypothetical protein